MLLKVLGMDPSLRNWGIAAGLWDTEKQRLTVTGLQVINPVTVTCKQVRQNSKDLSAAAQLYAAVEEICREADAVFAEVPVGSQSSRAMASYGICVGVLGSLQRITPIHELSPLEVKLAAAGKKTASKAEMIQWAMEKHPEAPWPMYTQKGITKVVESSAEHMADAIGTIYAGLQLATFKQTLQLAQLHRA